VAESFAEYLARYRSQVVTGFDGDDSVSQADVLNLLRTEYIKQHEAAVVYEYLGDDSSGYPVYRLGTAVVLQNIQTQLNDIVTDREATKIPGAAKAYSLNPSLR
jgi:hypothetical protein